jgi:hypothetical protein
MKITLTNDKEANITIKQVASLVWSLGSDEQAEFFEELMREAGTEHKLMMQFLYVRDECERLKKEEDRPLAMDCFQSMFASAYKYMW